MRLEFVLGAALLLANASPVLAQECVEWGEPIELSGFLVEGVYPGPPEYESVAKGDEALSAIMLHLRNPICVNEGADKELEPALASTELVQLACDEKAQSRFRDGELNTVAGSLFAAHTGYHVTPALLSCN